MQLLNYLYSHIFQEKLIFYELRIVEQSKYRLIADNILVTYILDLSAFSAATHSFICENETPLLKVKGLKKLLQICRNRFRNLLGSLFRCL